MRLLNIDTFEFTEFYRSDQTPPYIVTSHRWTDDEVTYKDVLKNKKTHGKGYEKVMRFCELAKMARLHSGPVYNRGRETCDWIWIDTVGIFFFLI